MQWELLSHSYDYFPQLHFVIKSVTYSQSVRALSCAFIIAQSHTIDKVYLISWLHKVLHFEETTFWISYFTFFDPLVFKDIYFFQRTSLFKWLLPFLTFVNWEVPYRGLSSQTISLFDIAFVQLGVISSARNSFAEIVETVFSKKQPFRICFPVILCLSWWKNINKEGRNFFVPSLQYSQFGQDRRKNRTIPGR